MSYRNLEDRFKRIGDYSHALETLRWDQMVVMPRESNSVRTDALATLEERIHELTAAPEVGEWIESAGTDLDPWQAANVERIRRLWLRAGSVPGDLVAALAKAKSICHATWETALGENDWNAVRPKLATLVGLAREYAAAVAEGLRCDPYEALVDEFEPGLGRADIEAIFDVLRSALPPLIETAVARQREPLPLKGPFPIGRQEALGRELMRVLGFDFGRGRLDVSAHPFCGEVVGDTRITSRYRDDDFFESMFATVHETGHGLYQQGLPYRMRGQPVGNAAGTALHESQSLLIERQVCRGTSFMEFAAPVIQRALLGAETDSTEWQSENLVRLARHVRPGPIRVEADELTYSAHVILRFETESALVDGTLAVADLPEAWDEKMNTSLGISTAGDFRKG